MKRLLFGAVLAILMSFAFASVASAQSFHVDNPTVGSTCPKGDAIFGDPGSGLTCYTPQDIATLQSGVCANTPSPQAAIACLNARKGASTAMTTTPAATTPAATIPPGTARCEGIADPAEFKQCVAQGGPIPGEGTTVSTPVAPTTTPAASTSTVAALPNTGGPALLLPAAALLVGAGLLALGLRRK